MNTRLSSLDDFQILRAALIARWSSINLLPVSPWDEARQDDPLDCKLSFKTYNNFSSEDWEVKFGADGYIVFGNEDISKNVLLNTLKRFKEALVAAGIKTEEKFWPVTAHSFMKDLKHFKVRDEFNVMQNFAAGDMHRSIFARVEYDFVNSHPMTLEMVDNLIYRIKKDIPSEPLDVFVMTQIDTLTNTVQAACQELKNILNQNHYSYFYYDWCSPLFVHMPVRYEDKKFEKSIIEKAIQKEDKEVYFDFESSKNLAHSRLTRAQCFRKFFNTKEWKDMLEAVRILRDMKNTPDFRYLISSSTELKNL